MKRRVCLIMLIPILVSMGCAGPFAVKPPGDEIARCSGHLRLENGTRTRFSIYLYRYEDDIDLYATIPGKGIRYRHVEDMNFEDDGIHLEFDNGREVYGEITGDDLEFDGRWKDMKGSFTLELH